MSAKDDIEELLNNQDKLENLIKGAFDAIDTDNSGMIDIDELYVLIRQVANDINWDVPSYEDVKEVMLEEIDTNKDGLVSLDEFRVLMVTVLNHILEVEATDNN